jgi:hypothetical protein
MAGTVGRSRYSLIPVSSLAGAITIVQPYVCPLESRFLSKWLELHRIAIPKPSATFQFRCVRNFVWAAKSSVTFLSRMDLVASALIVRRLFAGYFRHQFLVGWV